MRKLIPLLAITLISGVSLAIAAETKTITGDAVCGKCALKETAKCQNVVIVEEGGKTVNYYLTGKNSDKVHKTFGICGASKDAPIKVKVTGDLKEEDGKNVLEVKTIEKAD